MLRHILRWIEFCSIGIITAIVNSNKAAEYYKDFYKAHLGTSIQKSLPAEFDGVPAWFVTFLFATAAVFLHARLSRAWFISPAFVNQVQIFSVTYFNDRIHELHRNNIDQFARDPQAHRASIIRILYDIRNAIQAYSASEDIRVTLMLPYEEREGESQTKLYIRFWANKTKETPQTRRLGKSFAKGEGFAGHAWKTGKPQVGGKKILGLFPEPRYKKMSDGHDHVKSFMAIPIYDESPDQDSRPILGVLCIDAPERFLFPKRKRKLRNFIDALKPYCHAIVLHLLFHDYLIKPLRTEETSSTASSGSSAE